MTGSAGDDENEDDESGWLDKVLDIGLELLDLLLFWL